MTVNKFLIYS